MIREEHGVTIAHQERWADGGVEEIACELRWLTEPGWLTLEVEAPTLLMMAAEIGGRCDFRAKPDQAVDDGYFGAGALALVEPGAPVVIHAAEMRQGRLCCFSFRPAGVDYLSAADIAAFERLQNRCMFHDERISTCAMLLDGGRLREDSAAYILSLSKALFAAVLASTDTDHASSKEPTLTGASWDAILRYIRDHLEESITVDALAEIVHIDAARFGAAFRQATGMSVRQWQMDYRVRSAQRLLTDNPNESLEEVAILCGFADHSHFSRAFLHVVGLTPTAWLHSRN